MATRRLRQAQNGRERPKTFQSKVHEKSAEKSRVFPLGVVFIPNPFLRAPGPENGFQAKRTTKNAQKYSNQEVEETFYEENCPEALKFEGQLRVFPFSAGAQEPGRPAHRLFSARGPPVRRKVIGLGGWGREK